MASNNDVTLANGTEERVERERLGVTCTMLSRSDAANAVISAQVERMRADITVTAEQLAELDGEKVTLILTGSNMMGATLVIAREGRLFNDGTAILPKGKRRNGNRVDASSLLGVVDGYDVDAARALYETYTFGDYTALTADHLGSITGRSSKGRLVAMRSMTDFSGQRVHGALWVCSSYTPDGDIVDGYLVAPGGELTSEFGSIHGTELTATAALMLDAATGIDLGELDDAAHRSYDDALAVLGLAGAAVAA